MKKRWLLAGASLSLFLGLLFGLFCLPQTARADKIPVPDKSILTSYTGGHTLRYVEINGQECYIFQSYDKKKTSSIYYRTKYLQISRIQDGIKNPGSKAYRSGNDSAGTNQDPHKYFANSNNRMSFLLDMDTDSDPHSYTDPGDSTHVISTWVFTREKINEDVGYFDKGNSKLGMKNWKKEIEENEEKGQPTWMGLDAIIIVYHGTTAQGGYRPQDKSAWGKCYNWSTWSRGYTYTMLSGKQNSVKSLINCEPWGASTKSSFRTHYDKYFKLKNKVEKEPETTSEYYYLVKNDAEGDTKARTKNVDTSESNHGWCAPNLYTYNFNKVGADGYSQFDLQEGIPTTESVTNGIDVDRWYGSVMLKKTTTTVYVRVPIQVSLYLSWSSADGKDTGSDVVSYSQTKTYKATVEYWTLNSIKMYELQQTDISNECFEDTLQYMNEERIPWKISLNGRTYSSSTDTGSVPTIYGSYSPTAGTHLSIPDENDIGTIYVTSGGYGTSYGAAYAAAYQSSLEQTRAAFNSRARAGDFDVYGHNDILEINGTSYSGDGNIKSSTSAFLGSRQRVTRSYNANGYLEETATFDADSKFEQMPSGKMAYDINEHVKVPETTAKALSDTVRTKKDTLIPEETLNGPYYTTIASRYSRFITGLSLKDADPSITNALNDITSIKDGYAPAVKEVSEDANQVYAKKKYTSYEPIFVHSPAIAPISIKGENTTQAENYGTSADLILDNTYTVTFDWKRYLTAKGYHRSAGWEKYIKMKQVRFPFDVECESLSTSGEKEKKYFHVEESTGYTDWITVGMEYGGANNYISAGSTLDTFQIYIPSWAEEGVYGAHYDSNPKENLPIQVKVYANNYDPELGFDEKDTANTRDESDEYAAGEPATYVATYNYDVQVSGVMYGFQVDAINDELEFGGITENKDGVYNFVTNAQEKKVGKYNRYTEDTRYVRATASGKLSTAWSYVNTLPFANGKSNVASHLDNGSFVTSSIESEVLYLNGLLKAGHQFSFQLNTIATAYDSEETLPAHVVGRPILV